MQSHNNLIDKWFPRGGLARNVSILVGGTAIAQLLAVASSPVLTRLYKPSDFGALQVFISLLGLALVAASGRYEIALLLPEDEQSSIDVLAVAGLCVCMTTAVVTGIVVLSHFFPFLPAAISPLKKSLWLLPISLFGAGVYQVLSYWAMRKNAYKQLATTKFLKVGAQIGTQIGGGVLHAGSLGLIVGDVVGRIVGSWRFLEDLWRQHAGEIRAIRPSRMIKLAVRYRDYPLISMWGALINSSGLAVPSLFLVEYFGAQETGWFALVNRVLGVPGALIGANIAQVYASEAAKLARSDPKRLMYIFLKTTRHMLYLGLVPCLLFTIFAPWLFELVFGHPWREAGEYARSMAFMFYAGFINAPVQFTLNILERQSAQFIWDATRLVLTCATMAVPHFLRSGPRAAILSYATAMTIMYAIHWTQSYFAIGRCIDRPKTSLADETLV